jgi:hypothetical protein
MHGKKPKQIVIIRISLLKLVTWNMQLTHDKFLVREYSKFKERKIDPCEMLQKINDNAYQLHFHSHLKTFKVYSVQLLSTCLMD